MFTVSYNIGTRVWIWLKKKKSYKTVIAERFLSGTKKRKTDCCVNFQIIVQINIEMYVLFYSYDLGRTVTQKNNKMSSVQKNTAAIIMEFFFFFFLTVFSPGYSSRYVRSKINWTLTFTLGPAQFNIISQTILNYRLIYFVFLNHVKCVFHMVLRRDGGYAMVQFLGYRDKVSLRSDKN